jgi:hypothetical protein
LFENIIFANNFIESPSINNQLLISFQAWSREETDKLFELCERFDLRFIVIVDRFPTDRSMEDLKSRYYSGTLYLDITSMLR